MMTETEAIFELIDICKIQNRRIARLELMIDLMCQGIKINTIDHQGFGLTRKQMDELTKYYQAIHKENQEEGHERNQTDG